MNTDSGFLSILSSCYFPIELLSHVLLHNKQIFPLGSGIEALARAGRASGKLHETRDPGPGRAPSHAFAYEWPDPRPGPKSKIV